MKPADDFVGGICTDCLPSFRKQAQKVHEEATNLPEEEKLYDAPADSRMIRHAGIFGVIGVIIDFIDQALSLHDRPSLRMFVYLILLFVFLAVLLCIVLLLSRIGQCVNTP
ncbi:hypothetical protein GF359_10370 [candidate division WOR-3 bacterium]|uniref:Transmembrane protein n=1 Tax=candidate division WOR-3 bacterium TaxID=2052148 RepID=A0A9D5KCJ8_UNCW3|nr:hypothetical protein [candidate division WOR-3 bacterium]MBD3365605.1 hypothetical protein [candidate division WOR-3 bacterium]